MYFRAKLFLNQKLGKFKKILRFRCQFNQISYILAKFHKYFNTKKMNKINNGKLPFASKHIASNEYLLILFHYLMSMTFYQSILYFHMDTPPLQYVKILARNRLGTLNDRMYVIIYVFNMCTRKVTISMQMNQNLWNSNPCDLEVKKQNPKVVTRLRVRWFIFVSCIYMLSTCHKSTIS